jgi:hypothetical protein
MVVLPGSLSLGVHNITFHAHPPKGMLRNCQLILPRNDGAFHAVQLHLLGEELLL